MTTATGVLFGSALVLLPMMLVSGQTWFPQQIDSGAIATLLAIAINAVFLMLFLEIIGRAGPVFFAQFNYLAVLAGVAWAPSFSASGFRFISFWRWPHVRRHVSLGIPRALFAVALNVCVP